MYPAYEGGLHTSACLDMCGRRRRRAARTRGLLGRHSSVARAVEYGPAADLRIRVCRDRVGLESVRADHDSRESVPHRRQSQC